MKIFKKLFSAIAIFLLVFSVSGCNAKKDIPTGLKITNGIVTWNSVKKADKYRVKISETTYDTTKTSFDLNELFLDIGDYQVSVASIKKGKLSNFSNPVTFTVGNLSKETSAQLLSPQVVMALGDDLTWEEVAGADSYIVWVGNKALTTNTNSLDLSILNLPLGMYEITVFSVTGEQQSQGSRVHVYQKNSESDVTVAQLYSEVLKLVDESYVPNMTLEDFQVDGVDEYEAIDNYFSYREVTKIAYAYSESMVFFGKSKTLALDLFEFIIDEVLSKEIEELLDVLQIISNEVERLRLTYTEVAYTLTSIIRNSLVTTLDDFYEDDLLNQEYVNAVMEESELLVNTMDAKKNKYIYSLTTIMDFAFCVYNDANELLREVFDIIFAEQPEENGEESPEISFEDYITLKDEIIPVLFQYLPTEEDFGLFYELSYVYAELALGEEILTRLELTNEKFGFLTHNFITLGLKFVDYIDAEMIDTYIDLSYKAMQLIEVEDDEGNIEYIIDNKAMLDSQLFILTELRQFTIVEADLIDELKSFDYYPIYETYMFLEQIGEFEDDNSLEAKAINQLLRNLYDFIFDSEDTLFELIDHIIETEALLFYDIIDFMDSLDELQGFFDKDLLLFIDEKLDELVEYNEILIKLANEDNLLAFARFYSFSSYYQFGRDFFEDIEVYLAMMEDVEEDFVQILANVIELEKDFLQLLSEYDLHELVYETYYTENEELLGVEAILVLLNEYIQSDSGQLFLDTLDLFFDNVLSHELILEMQYDNDINIYNDFVDSVKDQVSYIFSEIEELASYDFNDLSQEQIDRFGEFIDTLFGNDYDDDYDY